MAAEATTVDPVQNQPTEPASTNWKEDIEKQWFGLQLGERAWMLNKWQQQQEVVMDDIRRARDPSGATSGDAQEGDVAGVNVGNTIHNYYSSQQANATDNSRSTSAPVSTPEVSPAPSPAVPAVKAGLSTLAKLAIAAGLVGTGGIGGLAIPAAFNWLTKPTVNITAPAGIDTNAAIELGE